MSTYADNAKPLGKSRNEGESSDVTVFSASADFPPPGREHVMTIRVYDYCPEHGAHTDPDLTAASGL